MTFTNCPTCSHHIQWSWEEAFDKFGFDDGDGIVMTEHVAGALRLHGYTVQLEPWGIHNVTISSIKTAKGKELIPFSKISFGYADPRTYLPKRIIALLDAAFTDTTEVEP